MRCTNGSPWLILVLFGLATILGPVVAGAQVVVLDFEGLLDNESVAEYYNNGYGGSGSGPGPDLGVSFLDGQARIDSDAGGTGDFGGEPSPSTALFWLSEEGGSILNVPAGFSGGIAFYYSSPVAVSGTIDIYDGLNGTGMLLGSLMLAPTPVDGGDPTGTYSPFIAEGIAFSGVAKSIDFSGTANQIAFDNLTLGRATVDPEDIPTLSHWGIIFLICVLCGIACSRMYRQRKA